VDNSLGLVFVVSSTLSNTANTVIIGGVRSS